MTNPEATSEATSAATSAAEIIKPTIEAAIPEPTPTEKIEPTEAIVETAVPDPTRTTEPEPTETSIPIPTETPIPLPELGLLSTISREKDNQFMFYVPAGSFQMGASASDTSAEGDESPLHEVTLAAFWIDTSEVTNQQYQICIDEGPCRPVASAGQQANENNYPRVNVTWEDALTYCEWVDRDGTLPTEAQWEYAARGTDARIYPWGNEAPTCQRANYGDCNNYRPKPVESSPRGASWSGALDMSGNVYEWVSDWYSADFYKNSPVDQPINMTPSHAKVRRGGSYFHQSTQIRATNRDSLPPEKSAGHTGFRCVVNITD
ncbi:MAG: SUMF1/EgtB/PvdO family nonheme iron enzyme [Anaerolineae bacterium]|nr:SUMF1/EgtB/PvdO family nonheme iron enzyme [Anaerolineae bacterium]